MVADYLANDGGHSTSFAISENVNASGTKQTITVTNGDGSSSTFDFSGIVKVTFTKGTADAYPNVEVDACSKAGVNDTVTFGAGTPASSNP
ncbi:MAG: hypothetical protein IJ225_05605 [Solobacterium sp.]|nr:hypothetical protein [Solobacterium sp.]